jgi:bacterial/archaeal transporter family protein
MVTWLIFALLSAVFAAFVAIFGKIGLQGIDSNIATAIRAGIMFVFMFSVVLIQGKFSQIPEVFQNHKALFYIVLSGIVGALSWLFYFLALKFGNVSQVAPIDKLSVVFAFVLAVVILGESVSWVSIAGIVLITIGSIVVVLGS